MFHSTDDDRTMIEFSETTLNNFREITERYPNLVFTNIDANGKLMPKTVWIYPKDRIRRGNVFVEVWQHKDRFDLVMKKSIMTEEEIAESSKRDRKPTAFRGTVARCFTYREELIDYLVPKLNMIDTAK